MNCRLCNAEVEDQKHLLQCEHLQKTDETQEKSNYSDIYGKDPKKIHKVMKLMLRKIKIREDILNNILDL